MNWRYFFAEHGEDELMYHDFPECGPGRIEVEELYQAIKARFIDEMSQTKANDESKNSQGA